MASQVPQKNPFLAITQLQGWQTPKIDQQAIFVFILLHRTSGNTLVKSVIVRDCVLLKEQFYK